MPLRRASTTRRAIATLLALAPFLALASCGRLLTTAPDGGDVFDGPLEGLTAAEHAAFIEGDEQFGRPLAINEGLGPIFNNVSCASCHSGDGRGQLENTLTRFSLGSDLLIHLGGPQIQDRAIPGATAEQLPPNCEVSKRLPPPVFGMGLIEAIPAESILVREDPTDTNGDGISGRANMVMPPDFLPEYEPGAGPGPVLGRLGRKAQTSSVLQQTVDAYHQDMGITTDFRPDEIMNPVAPSTSQAADRVADPELPARIVQAVVAYLRLLAPPAPGPMNARRELGSQRFDAIGCASCHVPTLRTGPSTSKALAHKDVNLFSDLLLHDMGDGLADYRSDGGADGREWRTTPLWGLRIVREFLDGKALFLHDGRARTVEEAILLHGGEAQASRDAFAALSAADRAALLDFVESR